MAKKHKINILVKHPEKEFLDAFRIIDKFLKLNNIKLDYDVVIDCSIDSFGVYYSGDNQLHLNLDMIKKSRETRISDYGYSEDLSIVAILVHEFCHMLENVDTNFPEYRKEFKEKNFINYNSNHGKEEEFTELHALYIINPYFLKLIEEDAYIFFQDRFKSPTPCTKQCFNKITANWSDKTKEHCLKNWKIKI